MKLLLLLLLSPLLMCFSNEEYVLNHLSIKEVLDSLEKIQKKYITLSDGSYIMYFLDNNEVKGVCRISTDREKEFYVEIEDRSYVENGSIESFHDLVEVSYTIDGKGTIVSKNVGEILSSYYRFDQAQRLISFKTNEVDILFINRGNLLTKIRSLNGQFEEKTFFMVEKMVLGEDASFVLKDLKGDVILAVIDDVPYLTCIDREGSLREILDVETKEVVGSVRFSKNGHIVSSSGLTAIPFCFKGMVQEKISEIYFDVGTYYDPDIGLTFF